jgi:branched-subunit amino acid ABC-type transport system permease component
VFLDRGGDQRVAAILERVSRRQNRATLIAALLVAAFVAYFVSEFWRTGQTVDTDKIIRFLVVAITYASIYGIAASGLVVTYTTSGIFNFAQGAIGMFLAFMYWQLKAPEAWGIPTIPALVITLFIVAPLLGAIIERLIMRRLADAPLVGQLVATIGLLAFFIGLADIIWASNTYRSIGFFFGGTSGFNTSSLGLGNTVVTWYHVVTIVTGIVIAFVLRAVLYRTRLGVSMRAVVDNRELAALNGARPGRVSMFAWMLSTAMAGVAGIFLAQELVNLDSQGLTIFIVEAFAAAIIGRLRSLPMTLVGGVVLGIAVSFQREFLDFGTRWADLAHQGVIPGIILFLSLLFLPQARIEGRRAATAVAARVPTIRRAVVGFLALFAFIVLLAATMLSSANVVFVESGVVAALIMLSLVPLTGWAGQISFAQITFVGFGAWAGFEFSKSGGDAFGLHLYPAGSPFALIAAAIVAMPIGLLMALPALRLQGLYLALASMAFALMAPVIFDFPEVFSNTGRTIEPLKMFGFTFDQPFTILGVDFPAGSAFLIFATFLLCVVGLGVVALRRSIFGRRLVAMRDSPAACATLGVNLLTTKLAVFALSAAIAGFAGAVLAIHQGSAQSTNFAMLEGLPFLLLLVVGGVGVVSGAVFGAGLLTVFTQFLPSVWFPTTKVVQWWAKVGPGLAGVGIARQPEGVIPQVGHDVRERRRRAELSREKADAT